MSESVLLERDEALDALGTALDAGRAGHASAVFVVGEAGLGKSAVLAHAASSAGDFEVLAARGEAIDVVLPFGYLAQIFAEEGSADLLARSTSGMPPGERLGAAWEALRHFLDRAGRGRLLLLLDDLQWADADSLVLIGLALRHLPARPLVIAGALRPWPPAAADATSTLCESGVLRRVRLAPLSSAGSATLLETLTGHAPDPCVQARLDAWCAGNPFLVHQIGRSLVTSGDIAGTGDVARRPGAAEGWSALLLGRFADLDATGLDFARAAAVCGVQFALPVAADLAGVADAQLAGVLGGLCASGLVREGEARGLASFTHALLRQVLYEDMPAPLRAHLHAGAFRLLWDRGAPAAEAAHHAVSAGLAGEPDAVAAAERAGLDALAAGALDAAAGWLKAAVDLAGGRAEPGLRLRLAEALHACGALGASLDLSNALLAEQECSARARRLVGRVSFELGDTSGATETLRVAAARALAQGERGAAIETLLEVSLLSLYAAGPRQAMGFAADAHDLLGPDVDQELAAWVTGAHGFARMLMADPGGAAGVAAGLALVPSGSGLRGLRNAVAWGPRLMALQTAKFNEDFDTAVAAFGAATSDAKRSRVPLALSAYSVAHADTLTRLGRLVEARDLLNQASEAAPWLVSRLPWVWVGLAHVHFELDRADQARSYCVKVEDALGVEGDAVPALRLWLGRVRAGLALQDADADSACTLMDRCRDAAERSGTYHPCAVPWQHSAIASYMHAGRLADAEAVLEQLEAVFPAVPCRWPRSVAARGRAMLAERTGHPRAAEEHYQQALAWHAGLPMPLDHAETLLCYGAFLRRRGTPRLAREILAEAVGIAANIGARRLERLATEALHAAGGRRRGAARSTELTAAQLKVADLAAGGLTNSEIAHQLFISARTVEHHLTRVYETLGITSRRNLRRRLEVATRNDPRPP
ncbi:MAG: helix-turn-helix transcriptional regulator [Actinomycetes bacterium]